MEINKDNYYSNEINKNFLSKSIYWKFLECEAKEKAILDGLYEEDMEQTPLLVGNFIHSYFESEQAHNDFIEEHEQAMYKHGNLKNGLKEDYVQAQIMINTLKNDDTFNKFYNGEKEVIVQGKINGIDWTGKIDSLDLDNGIFTDLKTCRDIHQMIWNDEIRSKESFLIAYGYVLQMAIYQELIKQTFGIECQPLIIAVSKDEVPDKALIEMTQQNLDFELDKLKQKQDHVKEVIDGLSEPKRCERCNYCRSTKKLSIVNLSDL